MSDLSAHLDRLKQQGRALLAQVRPHHLAVLAGVAVIGVGVVAVAAMARPEQPVSHGDEKLRIQVVAPEEPEITPGSVMEVGHLVDGFRYTPPPPAPVEDAAYAPYDELAEAPDPPKRGKPFADGEVIPPPQPPEEPQAGWRDSRVGRWLGFDAPEPDYRAEREARRARRDDRAQQERDRRDVRRYGSEGTDAGRE